MEQAEQSRSSCMHVAMESWRWWLSQTTLLPSHVDQQITRQLSIPYLTSLHCKWKADMIKQAKQPSCESIRDGKVSLWSQGSECLHCCSREQNWSGHQDEMQLPSLQVGTMDGASLSASTPSKHPSLYSMLLCRTVIDDSSTPAAQLTHPSFEAIIFLSFFN